MIMSRSTLITGPEPSVKRIVLVGLLLVVALTGAATVQAGELRITEMVVTSKISRGKPIDAIHRISSATVKALYCFTRINNPSAEETTITHVWYRNGQVAGEYQLPVSGTRWRTYSRKAVEKGMTGDWRIEARDPDGNLLKEVKFRMN